MADPQKEYGSYLRDTEKVSFQKLHVIKDWYRTTFGKQTQRELFASDLYIYALSAVRNVITHKAGVADRKYVDAIQTFPELSAVKQGEEIHLNGQIVCKLKNSAATVGRALLLFVDEQLVTTNWLADLKS